MVYLTYHTVKETMSFEAIGDDTRRMTHDGWRTTCYGHPTITIAHHEPTQIVECHFPASVNYPDANHVLPLLSPKMHWKYHLNVILNILFSKPFLTRDSLWSFVMHVLEYPSSSTGTVEVNHYCANRNKSRLLFSSGKMFKKPLWQTVWTQTRLHL